MPDYYAINGTMTQLDNVPAEFRRLGIESYTPLTPSSLRSHFAIDLM